MSYARLADFKSETYTMFCKRQSKTELEEYATVDRQLAFALIAGATRGYLRAEGIDGDVHVS